MGCQFQSTLSVDCRLKVLGFAAPSFFAQGVRFAACEESDQYSLSVNGNINIIRNDCHT
jgi:hypothetical protein